MSICFQRGEAWEYGGVRLRFERELSNNLLLFYVERTLAPFQIEDRDGLRTPDEEWALQAFAAGDLRLASRPTGCAQPRKLAATREYDCEAAASLDPKFRLRRFVLEGLDAQGHVALGECAIGRALDRLYAEKADQAQALGPMPCPRTVKRWLASRGTPGERQVRQMVSLSGRTARARRLPLLTIKALQRSAGDYWGVRARSIEDAYALLFRRLSRLNGIRKQVGLEELPIPSKETLRLEIRRLECRETYAAKHGERKAAARFKGIGPGLSASRALRLGCMDHTLLDAVVVFDWDTMLPLGRPWLTVLIDVRTRCVVGFVVTFEPPSNYAATECIKRANRPKLHLLKSHPKFPTLAMIFGKFDEVIVDNGWELSGTSFQDMMVDVGTTVRWAPVASPTYKAVVERFFGILNTVLNHKLPGGVLKPEVLRELGYEPSKSAVLTLEQLEALIWTAVSYYHIEEHRTLRRPPASLWEQDRQLHGITVIGDDRQLDKMAGALKPDCRLTTSGVELEGLRFHDPALTSALLDDLVALEPVRGQRHRGSARVIVKVKYNPLNASEIHVWNRRRNVYVTLPCAEADYTLGLSFWQHRQIRDWSRAKGLEFSSERDRLFARAQLIAEVEASAPKLKLKQRRNVARLMSSAHVAGLLAERTVTVAEAPSRHDGLAPIIEHDPLAAHRADDGAPARPPPRGGKKPVKKARTTSAARDQPPTSPAGTTSRHPNHPDAANGFEPGADWKEFDL